MHIKRIVIKNFRNFSDFSIEFTTGFQTIIGENNVGKSNLYYAIRLVLDMGLSYKDRLLEEKDFHGFKNLELDDLIIISIDFEGENLAGFPNLNAIKTSENSARVTYLYAHKSKFQNINEAIKKIDIKDFQYRLYGGGKSLKFEDLIELNQISHKELDGINLFYITAFRNIYSDLHGRTRSLLSQYCSSRENAEYELESVLKILSSSSKDLNKLDFIPKISKAIGDRSQKIAGTYFSFPISLSFLSEYDADSWNQLNLFFSPEEGKNIPISILGLGQKNILYLSLFLAKLINEQTQNEMNILLIEEPEAHLHPQLQKLLFANLSDLLNTQVFMTSHSTHIASDCEFKNLNIIYRSSSNTIKSYCPFENNYLDNREKLLLKRYLDATRTELFFASAVILVEGIAEQFLIPAIAKKNYGLNLVEYNISVIPIYSRYFDPYLKLFQNGNLENIACAIIDGDSKEIREDETYTKAVANAKALEVQNRVRVFCGNETLELDLFPNINTNLKYLVKCFLRLSHKQSLQKLIQLTKKNPENWPEELLKRIDKTIKKGRFAQELAIVIDKNFIVPSYITEALKFIADSKGIKL